MGLLDRSKDVRVDRYMDVEIYELIDGWSDGGVKRWMNGWMDEEMW